MTLFILQKKYEETQNEDAVGILNAIRIKCVKNVIIGQLNINALANKFDALSLIIKDKLDILIICETKTDETFPDSQFIINGFKRPYRLDRNTNGGGVMIFVRGGIYQARNYLSIILQKI